MEKKQEMGCMMEVAGDRLYREEAGDGLHDGGSRRQVVWRGSRRWAA